jgi:hypothetical protein
MATCKRLHLAVCNCISLFSRARLVCSVRFSTRRLRKGTCALLWHAHQRDLARTFNDRTQQISDAEDTAELVVVAVDHWNAEDVAIQQNLQARKPSCNLRGRAFLGPGIQTRELRALGAPCRFASLYRFWCDRPGAP